MKPYLDDGDVRLLLGDCVQVMAGMEPESVDAVVTDPPYGLEFMGKEWDRPGRMGKVSDFGDADGSPHRRNFGTPSWTGSGNPRCQRCGGDKYRTHARRPGEKCECDAPVFLSEAVPQMRAFQSWCETWAAQALRLLKPGGYLLAFGGTRTFHRLTCAIEDAGFEVRDCLSWLYGSGFPKSLDVGKAIDRAAGAEREVVGIADDRNANTATGMWGSADPERDEYDGSTLGTGTTYVTAPATPEAAAWQGWGTALKPAWEPIILARRPLAGTVAGNVLAHGTGALNVDGCRVGNGAKRWSTPRGGIWATDPDATGELVDNPAGRWPANVVLDEAAAGLLDEEVGERAPGARPGTSRTGGSWYGGFTSGRDGEHERIELDGGGPSRFFYTAKASSAERDGASHPTVKPLALMRWLVRLVTPPGGLVLDPFAGSGTTGLAARQEGARAILIEREREYAAMAAHRLRQLSLL